MTIFGDFKMSNFFTKIVSKLHNFKINREKQKEIKKIQKQEELDLIRKRQMFLKKSMWNALVSGDYYKTPLEHYHFNINGEHYVYGILGLLGIFGDDMFYKIKREQEKIAKIKKEQDEQEKRFNVINLFEKETQLLNY